MDPNQPKNKLTPLPGAKLPPSPLPPHGQDAELARQIEQLAKDETNTLAVLAHGIRATAEAGEVTVALLQDIRDILVKVCMHTAMPLPARIQTAIEQKEYDPDEPEDDDEEDDEDDDGEGGVLATTKT